MTSGTEVVMVIILVWKEFVQDVMFTVSNTVKQCLIGILHELYSHKTSVFVMTRTPSLIEFYMLILIMIVF